jgi:serine/threonine protein kinase
VVWSRPVVPRGRRRADPGQMEASAPQSGFLIEQRELQVEPGPMGVLGTGALGEVRRGTFRGALVACKGLFMLRTDARSVAGFGGALRPDERKHLTAKFMQECRFMQECTHPNIVPFFGVAVDDSPAREPLYLVMQYIESGSLQDVIHGARYSDMRTAESGQCLPLEVQAVALVGMFSALEYLAGLRLIHRDVKPANILAVVEEQTLLKVLLADFGEAKQLSMTRAAASIAGTPLYMAPEMREEEEAKSPKADVFSAGVVAVELNTGCVPKPGPEAKKVGRRRVFVDEEERRAGDMARIRDPEIRAIAARCIVDDEEARADASEIAEYCRELLRTVSSAPPETTIVVSHSGGNKSKIAVSAATEVWHVKQQLEMDTGISAQAQELVYAGRALLDDKTVDDYSLLDGTTVQMIARLPEPAVMDHADAAAKSAQAEAADRERGQSGTGPSARVQSDSGREPQPQPQPQPQKSKQALKRARQKARAAIKNDERKARVAKMKAERKALNIAEASAAWSPAFGGGRGRDGGRSGGRVSAPGSVDPKAPSGVAQIDERELRDWVRAAELPAHRSWRVSEARRQHLHRVCEQMRQQDYDIRTESAGQEGISRSIMVTLRARPANDMAEALPEQPAPEPAPTPPVPALAPESAPEEPAPAPEETKAQREKRKKKERQARRKDVRKAISQMESCSLDSDKFTAAKGLLVQHDHDHAAVVAALKVLDYLATISVFTAGLAQGQKSRRADRSVIVAVQAVMKRHDDEVVQTLGARLIERNLAHLRHLAFGSSNPITTDHDDDEDVPPLNQNQPADDDTLDARQDSNWERIKSFARRLEHICNDRPRPQKRLIDLAINICEPPSGTKLPGGKPASHNPMFYKIAMVTDQELRSGVRHRDGVFQPITSAAHRAEFQRVAAEVFPETKEEWDAAQAAYIAAHAPPAHEQTAVQQEQMATEDREIAAAVDGVPRSADAPDRHALSDKLQLPPPTIGSAVVLAGLKAAPELNGLLGIVTGFNKPKGRYAVALFSSDVGTKNVKPDNCVPRLFTQQNEFFDVSVCKWINSCSSEVQMDFGVRAEMNFGPVAQLYEAAAGKLAHSNVFPRDIEPIRHSLGVNRFLGRKRPTLERCLKFVTKTLESLTQLMDAQHRDRETGMSQRVADIEEAGGAEMLADCLQLPIVAFELMPRDHFQKRFASVDRAGHQMQDLFGTACGCVANFVYMNATGHDSVRSIGGADKLLVGLEIFDSSLYVGMNACMALRNMAEQERGLIPSIVAKGGVRHAVRLLNEDDTRLNVLACRLLQLLWLSKDKWSVKETKRVTSRAKCLVAQYRPPSRLIPPHMRESRHAVQLLAMIEGGQPYASDNHTYSVMG